MAIVPRRVRSKDKIFKDRKPLAAILSGLTAQGKAVILTNGVFDLLHVGHTRCLEDARSRGDFLVVGVNSNKSAELLKGKSHPIVPCEERMEMLSTLWFVDYVIEFADQTADSLLADLQPTHYAKGSEYNLRSLPEKGTLKELGIKALFVGDKKGHSTTKIIQSVRRRKFG